jgi:hypothetical protein
MNKLEVLELLHALIGKSQRMLTAPDDPSGIHTTYLVDGEELLSNIQLLIDEEKEDLGDVEDGHFEDEEDDGEW